MGLHSTGVSLPFFLSVRLLSIILALFCHHYHHHHHHQWEVTCQQMCCKPFSANDLSLVHKMLFTCTVSFVFIRIRTRVKCTRLLQLLRWWGFCFFWWWRSYHSIVPVQNAFYCMHNPNLSDTLALGRHSIADSPQSRWKDWRTDSRLEPSVEVGPLWFNMQRTTQHSGLNAFLKKKKSQKRI